MQFKSNLEMACFVCRDSLPNKKEFRVQKEQSRVHDFPEPVGKDRNRS